MGYRPAVQEALDHLAQSGVYDYSFARDHQQSVGIASPLQEKEHLMRESIKVLEQRLDPRNSMSVRHS
jgi:hypothetical protein